MPNRLYSASGLKVTTSRSISKIVSSVGSMSSRSCLVGSAAKSLGLRADLRASTRTRSGALLMSSRAVLSRKELAVTALHFTSAARKTGGTNNRNASSSNVTPLASDGGGSVSDHGDKIWYQFKGFKPNPTNTFKVEFRRLSKHMGWTKEDRRLHRVKLFDADFEAHFGKDIGDLKQWQEFCRLCSIATVPDTIPECKEVFGANQKQHSSSNPPLGPRESTREHLQPP